MILPGFAERRAERFLFWVGRSNFFFFLFGWRSFVYCARLQKVAFRLGSDTVAAVRVEVEAAAVSAGPRAAVVLLVHVLQRP